MMEEEIEDYNNEERFNNLDFNFNNLIEEYQSQDPFKQFISGTSATYIIKRKFCLIFDNFVQSLENILEDNSIFEFIITFTKGDNIDVQSAQQFGDSLKIISKQIRFLSLHFESQENLGYGGIQAISDSLKYFVELETLNIVIDSNDITEIGISGICQSLQYLNNLTQYYLVIGFNNRIGPQGARFIGESFLYLQNLTVLSIQICQLNNIQSEGAIKLGLGLKYLSSLINLDLCILSGNNIGPEGAEAIGEGLKYLDQLIDLNLNIGWNNNVNVKGTKGLFQGIKKLFNLQYFSFTIGGQNNIGYEGVLDIANSFKELKNLIHLQFIIEKYNSIGSRGVYILGDSLKYLENLNYLLFTIEEVFIDQDGIKGISEGLKCLLQLKSIVITLQVDMLMRVQIIQFCLDAFTFNSNLKYIVCDFKTQKPKKQINKVIRKCLRLVEFR